MLIESTWGNSNCNMEVHRKNIMKEYGIVKGLGGKRFSQLHHAFVPNIEELVAITGDIMNISKGYFMITSF